MKWNEQVGLYQYPTAIIRNFYRVLSLCFTNTHPDSSYWLYVETTVPLWLTASWSTIEDTLQLLRATVHAIAAGTKKGTLTALGTALYHPYTCMRPIKVAGLEELDVYNTQYFSVWFGMCYGDDGHPH